jgi:tetratricopeptide (TPR) repeat protein
LRAQYLVDGVLSRRGERVSLEVGLIDARTDKLLWVSRHETEGGRIVEARDAVVQKVAATLLSKLRESERLRAAAQLPQTLDVYALTLRAVALKHRFTAASYREGRTLLETVLAADPRYAPAWWALGWLNAVDGLFQFTGEWSRERAGEAIAQASRSIELDSSSPSAWSALSVALQLADRHEESLAAAQRATELGPGDAEAWLFYARALMVVRPPAQAFAAVERALAMNPFPPVFFQGIHASVLWGNDLAEAAWREADACLRRAPLFVPCRHVRLLLLAETGRSEEARAEAVSLGQQSIRYGTACLRWAGSAANAERCQRHSRAAGLPP